MPSSKEKKLRKAYEFKLGKKLVSKLSDGQISILSAFYNSLSDSEQREVDSKIFKGETNDLLDMAYTMVEESEEAPSAPKPKVTKIKSSAIVPSKFIGGDRYQAYLDELTSQGTIGGSSLSPSERKEGFKKRGNKIDFEKFVDKVLSKKKGGPSISGGAKSLPVGGSAIVKSPAMPLEKFVKPPVSEETQGNLDDIMKGIDSILESLKTQEKQKEDELKKDKKEKEKTKREKKEKTLESGIFKGLAKVTEKVLAPVKSLFQKLFDFFSTILLGRVLYKIVEWMGDSENQGKIKSIIRFFSDWWPVIAGAYLLFGTKFGKLITTIGGWAIQIAKFAIPKLLRFVTKNPRTAAVLAGAGYLGARILTGTEVGADEEDSAETPPVEFESGGKVPGSGNKDTVPAMLTPGEFVMSKGAVNKFGADTLASMNAMGGGTNIPSFSGGGLLGFKGGGEVPGGDEDKTKDQRGPLSWVRNLFSGGSTAKKSADDKGGTTKGGISKNAKALLNTIRWAEGTLKPGGYNTWFGGRTDMDLTKMTINEVVAEQKRRLASGEATYGSYTSAAVGAYQMMKPEAFAARAGLNPATDKFTPENQDKMAIAGYMMGQAGMSKAEIDAPISRSQIAKIAPVWASLPMMNGASRYGQPVKRYDDLAKVYNNNLKGLDPNSYSASTTISSAAGGAGGGSGGGGVGGGSGGASQPTVTLSDVAKFDYMAIRKGLGIKTSSISKSSRPSSTAAYQQMQQQTTAQQSQGQGQQPRTDIPNLDAMAMTSDRKVRTLGITV